MDNTMRHLILSLTVTMACALSTLAGAAEEISYHDRFRLWNGCNPVQLDVEDLDDDAKEIGLSKERIETIVRSRLRAARMYTDGQPDFSSSLLYLRVDVAGNAFITSLEYYKPVTDHMSELWFMTITWESGSFGTYGQRSAEFILSTMSEDIDGFIDEFLRVNADAC